MKRKPPKDKSFAAWMDSVGATKEQIAKLIRVGEQTLNNWRCNGVPKRRQAEVREMQAAWGQTKKDIEQKVSELVESQRSMLLLKPSEQEWLDWMASFKQSDAPTVEAWAINAINDAAAVKRKSFDRASHAHSPRVMRDPSSLVKAKRRKQA